MVLRVEHDKDLMSERIDERPMELQIEPNRNLMSESTDERPMELQIEPNRNLMSESTDDSKPMEQIEHNRNLMSEPTDERPMELQIEPNRNLMSDPNEILVEKNEPQVIHIEDGTDLENGAKKKYFESDPGDGSTAVSQHLTGWPLGLTLASCVASVFIVSLDITIVTTILSKIGNEFHSFNRIGWLLSGMLLALSVLIPSYGKISIAFGRKNVALAGIIIFEIGSLVCALANSMDMLIGGRVIQGIGGGAVLSMIQVILTEIMPIDKRPLLLMIIGMTISVSSVLGPFIGGAFAQHTTWRWCFYINLPIGGVAILLLTLFFHPPKPKGSIIEKLKKIDYLGTLLLTSGLVLVLLALTFGGVEFPWKSAAVICNFVIGGLLLVAFSIWNFKFSKNQIIITELVRDPEIIAACFSGTFAYSNFVILLTYLASYFQVIFKASAFSSGVHLIPLLISVTLASFSNGLLIKKNKIVKPFLMLSAILAPAGVGVLLLLDVDSGQGKRIGCLILVGVLIGLMFQPSLLACHLLAPREIEGSVIMVTVLLIFTRTTFASVAVTLAQLIYQTVGVKNLKNLTSSLPKDSASYQILAKITPIQMISSPEIIEGLEPATRELVLKEMMKSFKGIFYFCMGLAALGIVSGLFVSNKRLPEDVATKEVEEGTEQESEGSFKEVEEEAEEREAESELGVVETAREAQEEAEGGDTEKRDAEKEDAVEGEAGKQKVSQKEQTESVLFAYHPK